MSKLGLWQAATCLLASETALMQLQHGPPSLFTLETFPLCAFKDFAITLVCVIFYSVGQENEVRRLIAKFHPLSGAPTPKKTS